MGAAEHRIGRVIFDVPASDQAASDRFGAMVRARFDAVIAPALETALDRVDRPGEAIRLGRLEVDLGTLDEALTDAGELARRITDGLAAALADALPAREAEASPARDDAAELALFLETGTLPWGEPGKALALLAATLMSLDGAAMRRLAARLRTGLIRRRAAERLVRQMPASLVRRLLRALLPDDLSLSLAGVFGADAPAPHDSASPAPDNMVPRLADLIRRAASGRPPLELGEVVMLFVALDGRIPQMAAAPQAAPPSRPEAQIRPARAATPERETTQQREADGAIVAASLPVPSAGAVLLHPFLSPFFERVGLLAEPGRFRDHDAAARAVLLAHHLATGTDEAPEPETVLFKLLCGMEFEEPIPRRIDITAQQREETLSVLTSVITYWHRLGQASPAGLRESFLSRPGQLRRHDDGWRLTVERRGVDILLDHLPWALSWVKTPFMRTALSVDWR
jgi:hypothetical protein